MTAKAIDSGLESARMVDDEGVVVRWSRGLVALSRLMRDPDDTEQVFVAGVNLGRSALPHILENLGDSADGRRILSSRPAIDSTTLDLEALLALPRGTLGREYAHFLRSRGLTPDLFRAPGQVRDEEARFVVQRIRQTHDLWHVLTGYETDVPGEVELQAFTFAQLRSPLSLLIAVFGTLRMAVRKPFFVRRALAAYRRGVRTAFLLSTPWEERWDRPVVELRRELGVSPMH
jgi:ubiquinone biosynthesis protein COQ4